MVTVHGADWFLGAGSAAILYLCWACLDVCYEDGNIILVEDVDKCVRGCVNIERDPESHRTVQRLWSRFRCQFICEKKQRGFVIRMFISQRKVWPPDKFGNIKYYSAQSAKYLGKLFNL